MHVFQLERSWKVARRVCVSAALAAIASASHADAPLFVSYENLNYSGTVTRYGSLEDAKAGSNALGTHTIATATNGSQSTLPNARDGQVFVGRSAPGYATPDYAYFSTSWYFTETPGNGYGWGNPNNTNDGFIQFYNYGTLATTIDGGWSNAGKTFTLNMSGGDGDSDNAARLWAPDNVGGPASVTGGTFHAFDLGMVASFTNAATVNGSTGWLESNATPMSLTGSVTGIFENQGTDTSVHGFYAFNFTLANGSWAADVGATYPGGIIPSVFAAPVPEPEAYGLALAGLAVVGLFGARRRRR